MATFLRFEDIEAWQIAGELTKTVFELTRRGGPVKDFALANQLRKSSISVMSNIAEGFERGGNTEFARFLTIAKGSAGELRSQLIIAFDVAFIDESTYRSTRSEAETISRLLAGLIGYLRASDRDRTRDL